MTERIYRILQGEKDIQRKIPSGKLLIDIRSPVSGLLFPAGSMGFVIQGWKDIMIPEEVMPEAEFHNFFALWHKSKKVYNSYLVLFPEDIVEVMPDDIEIFPVEKPSVDPDVILEMIKRHRERNGSP